MKLTVSITGSRDYEAFDAMVVSLDSAFAEFRLNGYGEFHIVSGGARGADKLAIDYAKLRGYEYTEVFADWKTYHKSAGHRRNVTMAEMVDYGIVFWDGISKGTRNMIDALEARNKPVKIVGFVPVEKKPKVIKKSRKKLLELSLKDLLDLF